MNIFGYIYKITNKSNQKIYVGKTTKSIRNRFNQHIKMAFRPHTYTSHLYNAIVAEGSNNFEITQLDTAKTEEELNQKEIFWIQKLDSTNPANGYNIQLGGEGGAIRSAYWVPSDKQLEALDRGRHLPSSTAQKVQLSLRRHNCKVSDSTREKLRQAKLGKHDSEETILKKSSSHLGKKLPKRSNHSRLKYQSSSKDRVHIHKGCQNKNPKRSELAEYLAQGWELGYCYFKKI